jgi:uncharacterized protein
MTKYFLLFALVLCVWWVWRKSASTRSTIGRPADKREPERMVECARCGVNQPVSESILADDRYYCCPAHLREARSDGA